ncbi:MAG: arylesterase [Cyclobacteriaceae bacterium]|nr:arylesterase [Cyclobacteriaceae bacterium]
MLIKILWFLLLNLFVFGFSAPDSPVQSEKSGNILFFGNSLTAGYGLAPEQAFPALIQKKVKEKGLSYEVINAGLSGETSAGGVDRVEWILQNLKNVDVFVLELGANDGLRGIDTQSTFSNLQKIIDKVKKHNPAAKIIIAGMQVPPNMGQEYTRKFQEIFPEIARKNKALLIPFLLENVAGNARLNLADGIHPNAEGQKLVAENVWNVLQGVL